MAAPAGIATNRWNQAVRTVAQAAGVSDADADAWLNQVWVSGWRGDEVAGRADLAPRLRAWLETERPDAPTLPRAFKMWAGG